MDARQESSPPAISEKSPAATANVSGPAVANYSQVWRPHSGMLSCGMAYELDDIRAQAECPNCGIVISVSYKTLRLARTVECQGCGETLALLDDTPIGTIQQLIDEV